MCATSIWRGVLAVAALALGLGWGGCGVETNRREIRTTPPRAPAPSRYGESFEYLRAYGRQPRPGLCLPGFHHYRLMFSQEYLEGPPAFAVFCHDVSTRTVHGVSFPVEDEDEYWDEDDDWDEPAKPATGRAQVRADAPQIWLDGRGITAEMLTGTRSPEDLAGADPTYYRIRPGSHDLHVEVWFRVAYETGGKFDWDKAKLKTRPSYKKTVVLRPGDTLMVLTGVYGTPLSDYDVYRYGTKVAVLRREETVRWLKSGPIPTSAEVLADTRNRAASNDPAAVYDIGYRHLLGIDLPQDTAQGQAMIRAAADAGYARAMVTLGDLEMLRVGDATKGDRWASLRKARSWYERALTAGSSEGGRQLLRELDISDQPTDENARALEQFQIRVRMKRLAPQPFGIRQSEFEAFLRERETEP